MNPRLTFLISLSETIVASHPEDVQQSMRAVNVATQGNAEIIILDVWKTV